MDSNGQSPPEYGTRRQMSLRCLADLPAKDQEERRDFHALSVQALDASGCVLPEYGQWPSPKPVFLRSKTKIYTERVRDLESIIIGLLFHYRFGDLRFADCCLPVDGNE
jgi:hypothetical protein